MGAFSWCKNLAQQKVGTSLRLYLLNLFQLKPWVNGWIAKPRNYKMGDNNEDPWLAPDKLYHVLFCLSLTLLFSKLASLTRYPFLKRQSIRVGAILSLFAGAAKEAADQIGLFPSAGASAKDAVADIIGVLIAAAALSMLKSKNSDGSDSGSGQTRRGERKAFLVAEKVKKKKAKIWVLNYLEKTGGLLECFDLTAFFSPIPKSDQ
ncbi:LOW QUALITY PROTEIN: hypothetical protein NC651_000527 [Populus alba x Populus x berolinensis]|nr:LOW QUALITY PROTEIN: hypothetical protein NC651_000527 [Populus alba x Populus x berolinensis]